MTVAVARRRSLSELEKVVRDGLSNFVKVGEALMEIRDGELYKQRGFERFEDYCREEYGMSRPHAYRHIDAARVVQVLPIGDTPRNEAQARALVPLLDDPVTMTEVWEKARNEGNTTAEKIALLVKPLLPPREATPSIGNTRESGEPSDRHYTAPPPDVAGIIEDYRDKMARARSRLAAVVPEETINIWSYAKGQIAVYEKVLSDLEALG